MRTAFHPFHRPRHRFLIEPGRRDVPEFYVVEGLVRAFFQTDGGREHTLQLAEEGWWTSDYGAYFSGEAARLSLECLEDCRLLYVSYPDCADLCRRFPELEAFWHAKLRGGYVAQQRRTLDLLSLDAQGRYDRLLARRPGLLQRLPKTQLATYLGVSRETLSRLGR